MPGQYVGSNELCFRISSQLRKHMIGTLCRLLLDHEILMDHQLLHLIHDVMAKVIDRINGNGDEEVGNIPVAQTVHEAEFDSLVR